MVSEQTAPRGIFCISSPVVHVDDDDNDEENSYYLACHQLETTSCQGHLFSSIDKLSSAAELNDPHKLQDEVFLSSGDFFVGSWQGNDPDGKGKYLWSDGCMYEGEWRKGKICGQGKMSWPTGATCEGIFMDGYLHGIGTYTGVHGVTYKGSWKKGKEHGYGIKSYENGDVYQGSWKHGMQEGSGMYVWKDGSEYAGDWEGGLMSGRGLLLWPNGDAFDGRWLDGVKHGHGMYTWANGTTFVGTWNKGLKDGKGLFYPSHCIYANRRSFGEQASNEEHEVSEEELTRMSSVSENELSGKRSCRRSKYWRYTNPLRSNEPLGDSNVFLERIVDMPPEIHKTEDINSENNERSMVEEQPTTVILIFEREYVQGVLINELVKGYVPSGSIKFPRRWHRHYVKDVKRPGVSIFKGHGSYDLMLNLQIGIRYSVGKITPESRRALSVIDFGPKARIWMNFPREGSQLTPPHQSADFKWKDYCPMVFRNLREMFNIDMADYMLSICGNDGLRELSSPGKSGSVFYLSQDDRFMIKTMRKHEVKVLLRMLPNYYSYVHSNKNTLITKFFGLHRVKPVGGQKVRFVVMGNIFCTELQIHRRFDLKGSSHGRLTDNMEVDENTTFKDLDLDYVFYLEASWRDALFKQIQSDCKFLESEWIMDYSLLLGLHFRAPEFPAIFSPTSCPIVKATIESSECPARPHVQDVNLKGAVRDDQEDNLLLPGAARLRIQLGMNMPARADRRLHREDIKTLEGPYSWEVYDVVLYFGIIDILQEYDMGKKLEHAYKSLQFNSITISAVDPSFYSKRFQDFIHQIFPVASMKA